MTMTTTTRTLLDYCHCCFLLFLLLGTGTFTTTRTAVTGVVAVDTSLSTFESCSTTADCNNEGNNNNSTGGTYYYCADIVEKCLPIGVCSEVFDCSHVDNRPYAMEMCSIGGTLDCQQGRCVMKCDTSTMDVNDLHVDIFLLNGTTTEDDGTYFNNETWMNEDASDDTDKTADDATTPTPTPCATTEDCSPRSNSVVANVMDYEYCSSAESCLGMGECAMVDDCTHENNIFAAAFCMGWYECQEGQCAKICGMDAPSSPPLPSTGTEDEESNSGSDVVPCVTIDDCFTGNSAMFQNEYCASDDTCLGMGKCRVVEDCNNENNQFAVAYCLGTMECEEGRCGMNCGIDDPTTTTGTEDAAVVPVVVKDGCEAGRCWDNTICEWISLCDVVGECGEYNELCESKRISDSTSAVSACGAANESSCLDGNEYCSRLNGICVPMGGCTDNIDCADDNNMFAVAMCIGTLECQEERCTKICNTTDASTFDGVETTGSENNNDSNSVLSDPLTLPLPGKWSCAADSDCTGTTEYCAQGTCLTDGMCLSSSDCLNPSNFRFTDKKCLGYQYCDYTYGLDLVTDIQSGDLQSGDLTETLVGECNRNCGVPCDTDNDPQQERRRCAVTGCTDTTMLRGGGRCPGAISCVVDYCEDNCPGIYFDAAGAVVTDCSPTTSTTTTSTTTTHNNDANNENKNDTESDEIITAVDYGDNGDSYGDAITDNITVTDADTDTVMDTVMKTPPTITCTRDADCNRNAASEGNDTAAAPVDWDVDGSWQYYCAQGICLEMGRCVSDSDCTNPRNQFDDIRCLGYLTCSGAYLHSQRDGDGDSAVDNHAVEGTATANIDVIWCTRICGESCEDDSRPATDCESVNPCGDDDTDTTTLCPGAVSCRLDRCGVDTCTAVYYNAAGEVVTDCGEPSVVVVKDVAADTDTSAAAAAVGDSNETNGTAATGVDSTNETMTETSSEGSSSSSSMDAIAATVPENSGSAAVVVVARMAVLSVVTTSILIAFSSSSSLYD